jgi:hypothetical protein
MFKRVLASIVLFLAPFTVSAQNLLGENTSLAGAGANDSAGFLLWLKGTVFAKLIDTLIGWTGALAVVFLIYGGYQYLTAFGNEEQVKEAHKTITWSLAGVALALLAFAIVQIVVNIDFGK